MNVNFPALCFRWLLIGLMAALVADPATVTALAGDDGDDAGGDVASAWPDDDGDDGDDGDDAFYAVAATAGWDDTAAQPAQPAPLPALLLDDDDDDRCEIEDDDGNAETDGFCNDQAIVRLETGADIDEVNSAFSTQSIDEISDRRLYLLQLPSDSNEPQVALNLEADSRVAWAELNYVDQAPEGRPHRFFLRGDTVPRAGTMDQAYAPALIGSAALTCVQGTGAVVAVIDSGLDTSHPAFANTSLQGAWNAFTGEGGFDKVADIGNGEDDDGDGFFDEMTGHGTHVAGIITQIAPGATILPVKALDSDGVGQAFYLARALYYTIEQSADVINLSLGSTTNTRIVREATVDVVTAGIFVAAAAGNSSPTGFPEFPATLEDVFGVAASDRQDRAAEFSSAHPSLDLSAPGVDIVSAFPAAQPPLAPLGSDYALWSGTSMAAPWAAGTAALLIAQHQQWDAGQVANRLRSTASPLAGSAAGMGSGRLDAAVAVDCGPEVNEKKKDKNKKKHKKKRKHRR